MGDIIDRDAVLALVKAHIKDARRTYAGIHQAQEPLAFVESLMVPAIRALPAASHPLAADARRALEADDVYGWINSLPAASSEDVRAGALKEARIEGMKMAVAYLADRNHWGATQALMALIARESLALIPGAKP